MWPLVDAPLSVHPRGHGFGSFPALYDFLAPNAFRGLSLSALICLSSEGGELPLQG